MTEQYQRIRVSRQEQSRLRIRVKPRVPPLEIELRNTGTVIEWRLGTTGTWVELIEIDDIDAQISVGTVTTLPAGSPATVVNVGTPQDVILDFGIPAGFVVGLVEGAGITIDSSDPAHPIIAAEASHSRVILCSGQSNTTRISAFSWAPPPNLLLWGWDGNVDDDADTGSAFAPLDGTEISVSWAMAAMEAWANPNSTIYLVNISIGALALSHWLVGATYPDMYQAIKQNVEAALVVAGAETIDVMQWWQGEGNIASPSGYVTDFATLMARFRAEDWFPDETPVVLHGISALAGAGYANFNRALVASAAYDPSFLRYVHTAALPVAYWDATGPVPYIHANADGLYAAGVLAWQAWRAGMGEGTVRGLTVDPTTGNFLFAASGIPGSEVLQVRRDQSSAAILQMDNEQANSAATAELRAKTNAGTLTVRAYPTQFVPYGRFEWTGSGFMQHVLPAGANNQFDWVWGSATRLRIDGNGNLAVGTGGTGDRRLHAEEDNAANNTVTQVARLTHTTSGTPAAGIGVGHEYEVETAAGNNEVGAIVEVVATDVTAAAEHFDFVWKLMRAGAAAAEKMRLTSLGRLVLNAATAGIGYATGAGGSVTQATSKATGVSLHRPSGLITLNAASLAADTTVSFVLANTTLEVGDVLLLNHVSGGTRGVYSLNGACVANAAWVDVRNLTAGALAEAIVIQFVVIKGATS